MKHWHEFQPSFTFTWNISTRTSSIYAFYYGMIYLNASFVAFLTLRADICGAKARSTVNYETNVVFCPQLSLNSCISAEKGYNIKSLRPGLKVYRLFADALQDPLWKLLNVPVVWIFTKSLSFPMRSSSPNNALEITDFFVALLGCLNFNQLINRIQMLRFLLATPKNII